MGGRCINHVDPRTRLSKGVGGRMLGGCSSINAQMFILVLGRVLMVGIIVARPQITTAGQK